MSHTRDPIERARNVVSEISSARFNRQTRTTCGTNALVVQAAAINPMSVIDEDESTVTIPTVSSDRTNREHKVDIRFWRLPGGTGPPFFHRRALNIHGGRRSAPQAAKDSSLELSVRSVSCPLSVTSIIFECPTDSRSCGTSVGIRMTARSTASIWVPPTMYFSELLRAT